MVEQLATHVVFHHSAHGVHAIVHKGIGGHLEDVYKRQGCGRIVMLDRAVFEKRMRRVVRPAGEEEV